MYDKLFLLVNVVIMMSLMGYMLKAYTKIKKIMERTEKAAEIYESRINNIDKDTYTICKYNKAILMYIKEMRKILVQHKGKAFDTALMKSIDDDMLKELEKEKYKDLSNFIPDDECLPFIEQYCEDTVDMQYEQNSISRKISKVINRLVDNSVEENILPEKSMYCMGQTKEEIKKYNLNPENSRAEYLILK